MAKLKAEYLKPNAESRIRKVEYGKLNTESRIRRVLKSTTCEFQNAELLKLQIKPQAKKNTRSSSTKRNLDIENRQKVREF